MNDERVLVLTIEVAAEPDPATCDIVIGTRPAVRGPTAWTDKARRVADQMASDILDDRQKIAEVKEEGVHRRYRIPLRVQDGRSSVDLPTSGRVVAPVVADPEGSAP